MNKLNILATLYIDDLNDYLNPLTCNWTDRIIPSVFAKAILNGTDLDLIYQKPKVYVLVSQLEYFKFHKLFKYAKLRIFEPYQVKNLLEWEVWQIHNLNFPETFRVGTVGKPR